MMATLSAYKRDKLSVNIQICLSDNSQGNALNTAGVKNSVQL